MLLHAVHAREQGMHNVLIRIVDTDVVVIAIAICNHLSDQEGQIWVFFGTGTSSKYICIDSIITKIGSRWSKALPVFHAITGCDTVSAFAGKGTKSAW